MGIEPVWVELSRPRNGAPSATESTKPMLWLARAQIPHRWSCGIQRLADVCGGCRKDAPVRLHRLSPMGTKARG